MASIGGLRPQFIANIAGLRPPDMAYIAHTNHKYLQPYRTYRWSNSEASSDIADPHQPPWAGSSLGLLITTEIICIKGRLLYEENFNLSQGHSVR